MPRRSGISWGGHVELCPHNDMFLGWLSSAAFLTCAGGWYSCQPLPIATQSCTCHVDVAANARFAVHTLPQDESSRVDEDR